MIQSKAIGLLAYLQITSPLLLLLLTLVLIICRVYKGQGSQKQGPGKARASQWLSLAMLVIYLGDAVLFTVDVFVGRMEVRQHREGIAVYLSASFIVHFLNHAYRMGGDHALSLIFYALSLCTEIGTLCVSLSRYKPFALTDAGWTSAGIIPIGARIIILGTLSLMYASSLHRRQRDTSDLQEITPLLRGTKTIEDTKLHLRDYLILWPFLRSSGRIVYLAMAVCVLLVLIRRALSFAIPLRLGIIIDIFGKGRLPWLEMLKYGLLLLLLPQLDVIQRYLWTRAKVKSAHDLALHTLEHIMKLDIEYHLSTSTATAVWDLKSSSSVHSFFEMVAFSVFPTAVSLVGSLFYMWIHFDVYYVFLVAYTAVCYLWATLSWNGVATKRQREHTARLIKRDGFLHESIDSWFLITCFRDLAHHMHRFNTASKSCHESQYKSQEVHIIRSASQRFIMILCTLLALLFAGSQVANGRQPVGFVTTILLFLEELKSPISNIFDLFFVSIQSNLIQLERLTKLLHKYPGIVDKKDAVELSDCRGGISFTDIHFSYGDTSLINGVTFKCKPGTSTAIVGMSGSGKSTILSLILRLLSPSKGVIRVDGQDIRDLTMASLRDHVGIVPQQATLSNDSVIENIRCAKRDATDEEIMHVCKLAGIHDTIIKFSEGYDTVIGEQGLRLSGGEGQRLDIARLFLKAPSILLFDEATSALDTVTEEGILASIREFSGTKIVIAHRLSTITKSDQILVMGGGKIVERGTHEELLRLSGDYHTLWEMQASS